MKKAMKLVWMVLFALPLITLTACGDDDEPENVLFEDFSTLIGKTRQGTIDYMGMQPTTSTETRQIFVIQNGEVDAVVADYEDNDNNILDKCATVVTTLSSNLKMSDVINHLTDLYKFEYVDEDEDYYFTHKNLDIYYDVENHSVLYIDTKTFYTKGGNLSPLEIKRLVKARLF